MNNPEDNLLLIEDNPDDAKLVQRTLANTLFGPFQVEWVKNLSDGLQRLRSTLNEAARAASFKVPAF